MNSYLLRYYGLERSSKILSATERRALVDNILHKTRKSMALLSAGIAVFLGSLSFNALANPVSQFPITIDGQFTDGITNKIVQGEWSDLVPLAFIAPADANGTLVPTTLGNPLSNSLLYAGLAPENIGGPVTSLYLMYAYLGRTNPLFAQGELIFHVEFPVIYLGNPFDIDVRLVGTGNANSFYDLVVLANGALVSPGQVIANGDAAAGFGPSPLSGNPHLLVELEVSLLIEPGFGTPGGPFPAAGLPGVYSPAPAFWRANAAKDVGDPPISAAIFTIKPDGSTAIQAIPEPSTYILVVLGLAALSVRRKH